MKYIIVLGIIYWILPLSSFAQSTDTTNQQVANRVPKKYESNLFKSLVDNELVSLSLVSPTLFDNWDKQLKIFKKRYENQNVLLLVSKGDSRQRSEFTIEFMKQRLAGKELMLAYAETVKILTIKYLDLDFKHHLHLKKD